MLKLTYIPDNINALPVYNRLVYGLKDSNGDYIQKGMPETIFLDKRMNVVPYKSNGYIFKVLTQDTDPNNPSYYIRIQPTDKVFLVREVVYIYGTFDSVYYVISAVVSKVYNESILVTNLSEELSNDYVDFDMYGVISTATAKYKGYNHGISVFHPHTLTVIPKDIYRRETKSTFVKHFVPETEESYIFNVRLSKGWNTVVLTNDTTGEEFVTVINVRYYASIMESYADEIYKWIQKPIDDERDNIFSYLSTRLMEMYTTYKDLMPNAEMIQRLGLILSVQGFVNYPGSNFSVKSFITALTGSTPYISPQSNTGEIHPGIFNLFNKQQTFSGNTFNIWLRNKQILRWLTFSKYLDNVPFYKIEDLTEYKINAVKVHPLETYSIIVNNVVGTFEKNDTVNINNVSAIISTASRKENSTQNITISNLSGSTDDLFNLVTIQRSKTITSSSAIGSFTALPILYYDWNFPVYDGDIVNGKLVKRIEEHKFDFSENPLNDDWQLNDCMESFKGNMNIHSLLPFAICSTFFPWDKFVDDILLFEPTIDEELYIRTHQEYIVENNGSSSSSSSSPDLSSVTLSRHSDYPTLLNEGDAILNKVMYIGYPATIYSNLKFNEDVIGTIYPGTIFQSINDLSIPDYNELGQEMVNVIYDSIFGFINNNSNLYYIKTFKYTGYEFYFSATIDPKVNSYRVKNGDTVISAVDISKNEFLTITVFEGTFNYIPVIVNGNFGYIVDSINTDEWVLLSNGNLKPSDKKNSRAWITDFPMDNETFLPDITQCTGPICRILDQVVDWSTFDAPFSNVVKGELII